MLYVFICCLCWIIYFRKSFVQVINSCTESNTSCIDISGVSASISLKIDARRQTYLFRGAIRAPCLVIFWSHLPVWVPHRAVPLGDPKVEPSSPPSPPMRAPCLKSTAAVRPRPPREGWLAEVLSTHARAAPCASSPSSQA